MIKRLRFVTRRNGLSPSEFAAAWGDAVALVARAPSEVRPLRAVACMVLHDVAGTDVPHDAISMAWFSDMDALRRFECWLDAESGESALAAAQALEQGTSALIDAEELVLRGADWLEHRFRDRAPKLKHMALARRAEGLTPAAFSERWRNRVGTIGGAAAAPVIAIPTEAKGHAYVQNHPLANPAAEWIYDAVNEVYFDDLAAMRRRIDFFQNNDVLRADADLVSLATFIAVDERVIAFDEQ